MAHDSQARELIGRFLLQHALMEAGIEVAIPIRDRGVDLIAYVDLGKTQKLRSAMIQLKVANWKSFSFDSKYRKFKNLRFVYVWNAKMYGTSKERPQFYVMEYSDTTKLTKAYKKKEHKKGLRWSTNSPSKSLCEKLKKFRIIRGKDWKKRLRL